MTRTTTITLVGVLLLFASYIIISTLFARKRWPSTLSIVVLGISGLSIVTAWGWLIDPRASVAPLRWRMVGATAPGLALIALTAWVSQLRSRLKGQDSPIESPSSEEKFSVIRVFKAYLIILAISVLVFMVWILWLTQST